MLGGPVLGGFYLGSYYPVVSTSTPVLVFDPYPIIIQFNFSSYSLPIIFEQSAMRINLSASELPIDLKSATNPIRLKKEDL